MKKTTIHKLLLKNKGRKKNFNHRCINRIKLRASLMTGPQLTMQTTLSRRFR